MRFLLPLVLLLMMTGVRLDAQAEEPPQPIIDLDTAADLTLLAELPLPGANTTAWSVTDRLAVGTFDGRVEVFDMSEPRAMLVPLLSFTVEGGGAVLRLEFSPNGDWLVVAHTTGLELWHMTSRSHRVLARDEAFGGTAFSPDGTALAVFSVPGTVSVWSLVTYERLLQLPERIDRPTGIAFAPDGSHLAVGEREGHLYLLPLSREGVGRWLRHADLPAGMTYGDAGSSLPSWGRASVAFSPSGRLLVNSDHLLYTRLWSRDSEAVLTTLVRIDDAGRMIRLTSDAALFNRAGTLLLTASGGAGSRTRGLYLWDVVGMLDEADVSTRNLYGEPTSTNPLAYLPQRGATSFALNPAEDRIASAGGDRVRLWGLPDARASATELAALSDLNYIAYCDQLNQTPLRPRPDQRVGVVWSWFATTPDLLRDHSEQARYTLVIDGQPVERWYFLTPPTREAVNNNNWTVYYYLPVGRLAAGAHEIAYEVAWEQPISDGVSDYGPGTQVALERGSCGIEVRE
jgi:WD40 repeat protein